MRLLATVILGVMLGGGPLWAQEDNVASATSALQSVLSTLKQSVQKLSLDNEQLIARDNAMKQQILQLQGRLGAVNTQGSSLNSRMEKLQDQNSSRAGQIADLQEENLGLDDHIQKDEAAIKLVQQSLDAGYQEDQRLLLQLKDLRGVLPADIQANQAPAEVNHQKEKLKLMKMIYDSAQRQESLHKSILELQKDMPVLPAAGALAHQQLLKEQVKDLESQTALYSQEKLPSILGPSNQWDDAQLRQLGAELKILEKNYAQLKILMEQMSKKAQAVRMTVSQHVEEEKLQSSLNDLKHQGAGLGADLDDLRSQMIELDKRKSRLEMLIKHLP